MRFFGFIILGIVLGGFFIVSNYSAQVSAQVLWDKLVSLDQLVSLGILILGVLFVIGREIPKIKRWKKGIKRR